ncbi:MAG: DUF2165 family protein [Actinocatenispora sp.]
MSPTEVMLWLKVLLVAGLAAYLSVFVLNNLTDPKTNSAAVGRMLSMRELRADRELGNGVVWRAVESQAVHRLAYYAVILIQAGAAVLLWWAAVLLASAGFGDFQPDATSHAVALADLGLLVFVALWLGVVVIGTWFSYWVKMGPVQQGHMTLLLLGVGSVIVVNLGI